MAKLSREQVINLIASEAQRQGIPQEYWPILVEVALAESGGNTDIRNNNPKTSDDSYGLWQFNFFKGNYNGQQVDLSNRSDISKEDALDPVKATRVALSKIKAGLDNGQSLYEALSPWGTRDVAFQTVGTSPFGGLGLGASQESQSMAAGGIDEEELGFLKRFANIKKKGKKSSPALDRINKEIDDYVLAMPDNIATDEAVATEWMDGLTKLQNIQRKLSAGETSWMESILDTVMQGYITGGVPAKEALAESERLLTQFGLDVGAIIDPYKMQMERTDKETGRLKSQYELDIGAILGPQELKEKRVADDAAILAENWLNERTQAQDALAAWNDKSSVYQRAADQAQSIFQTIFPFITSREGPIVSDSMKAGGPMNQLFNRLGMEYKEPTPIGTTQINPADYANQAIIAAGPQPSSVGAPPTRQTLTELLGAPPELPPPPQLPGFPEVPELPSPPQLPRGLTMREIIGAMLGLLEKDSSSEGGGPVAPTPPGVGANQFFGPPVPPGFGSQGMNLGEALAGGGLGVAALLAMLMKPTSSSFSGLSSPINPVAPINPMDPRTGARSVLPGYQYFGPPGPTARSSTSFPSVPMGTLGVPGGGGGGAPPAGTLGVPRGGGGKLVPWWAEYLMNRRGR